MNPLPDHTALPSEDGSFAESFQELPQSMLLTGAIWPILQQRHPDRQFLIGQDSGIYWRFTEPYLDGAVAPDWFYIPDVSPTLNGESRQSYVMWYEPLPPLIVIEFATETNGKERDTTPFQGKFWIYEKVIRPAYYAIYELKGACIDVYQLVAGRYQQLTPDAQGHLYMEHLDLALGIWHGKYMNMTLPWLRWWDAKGQLVLLPEEWLNQKATHSQQMVKASTEVTDRINRMAEKLRSLGIDPDTIS